MVSESGIKPDPSRSMLLQTGLFHVMYMIFMFLLVFLHSAGILLEHSQQLLAYSHYILKAGVMFDWTDECMCVFLKLKYVLTSEIVMAYPNDSSILILNTYA